MAKVSFTKLGLKTNQDIKTIEFNGQIIEVKQYLPVNDKLILIGDVINNSADNNNFANPIKLSVYTNLMVLQYYTNINFTDKQKEDAPKLYDITFSSGLMDQVITAIPEKEYQDIVEGVNRTAGAVYAYQNSILGILENISQDYSNLDLDATALQQKIADPNNMALLKDIITKLG